MTKNVPTWVILLLPLVLLAGVIFLFLQTNPVQTSYASLPPVENLSIQQIELSPGEFRVHVVNGGPDPVTIAQVLVDEAYWQFSMEPDQTLDRLESAVVLIEYPWVETEAHEIVLLTSTGATFSAEVELAVETPEPQGDQVLAYALVGFYVGVIPVGLGLLWFPAMRRFGARARGFILSLTVGLLLFLLVDTFLELIELAAGLPEVYQGLPLGLFLALLTWLTIVLIGNRDRATGEDPASQRKFVALLISVGIGFHNLGEGLVVGAAFALGEAALGSALVVGFILHNITEGVGIAAPVSKDRPAFKWFLGMLLIAGAPAILGALIGGFAYSPLLAVAFFGIGLGAIWQVIAEVGRILQNDAEGDGTPLVNWPNVLGLLVGFGVMYLTAFLVKF
jgi:zinc transporter ZupT